MNLAGAICLVTLAIALSACREDAAPTPASRCLPAQQVDGAATITAGIARLGNETPLPEEAPLHQRSIPAFRIDRHEVTNAQFASFVAATGYVTQAERLDDVAAVFAPTDPDLWRLVRGASWRHPAGPDSTIAGLDRHPVVQVTLADAQAYASWAGGRLPTEAEWEFAARGASASLFLWGNAAQPGGQYRANSFQGAFPSIDARSDGFAGTAPVACFPPTANGLYDMAGNVWEWTATPWRSPAEPVADAFVVKGGSFLCSDHVCQRYRPGARQPGLVGQSTQHTGFRIAYDIDRQRRR